MQQPVEFRRALGSSVHGAFSPHVWAIKMAIEREHWSSRVWVSKGAPSEEICPVNDRPALVGPQLVLLIGTPWFWRVWEQVRQIQWLPGAFWWSSLVSQEDPGLWPGRCHSINLLFWVVGTVGQRTPLLPWSVLSPSQRTASPAILPLRPLVGADI